MSKSIWNIKDLLSIGESLIYKCELKNEDEDTTIQVYLTNYRILWIEDEFVDSRLLKFISKYGVFVGYENYHEDEDKGTGEYGIYFGDTAGYESLWFYSKDVWKTFYDELSRCLLEE